MGAQAARTISRRLPNGEVTLDYRVRAGPYLRISPWSAGLALHRWTAQGWQESDWSGLLLGLAEAHLPGTPLHALVSGIPASVQQACEPFLYAQLLMLQCCAASEPARELLQTNPVLLWLLASYMALGRLPRARVFALLSARQRDIVAALGGVATPAAVALLRKLHLAGTTKRDAEFVSQVIRLPELIGALAHLPRVPLGLVGLLLSEPSLRGARVLHKVAEETLGSRLLWEIRMEELRGIWTDTIRSGQALGIADALAAARACRGLMALTRLHDRWTARLNGQDIPKTTDPFPPPPVPGSDTIVPLTTTEALWEEGRTMQHCAGSYVRKVQEGQSYLYRVLAPERATLELGMQAGRYWIAQLKLACNGVPSEATWEAVRAWLDRCSPERP